ncbi:MAG: hybrid sensor histidine kinase/response regulator, partial [Thalassolituus sp.]
MADHQLLTNRRSYNRWVANQTLEDFALRFTAKDSRHWSAARVSNTALGAISFLALEAIGAAITLVYGVESSVIAIMVVSAFIFLTAIPISYYAARYGVDSALLTRGAGFGYIGSTVTSLIYASFTFIFMALESAIMASAMEILFGVPLWLGYLISALVVIPLVTHGITLISRFQLWTQPIWLLLQVLPFVFILWHESQALENWMTFDEQLAPGEGRGFNLIHFGAASAVIFALIAQIGEQVDFLRFLPEPAKGQRLRWWTALMVGGPGWIVLGAVKILAGSFLVVLALNHGLAPDLAADPTRMYAIAFGYLSSSPLTVMALTGIFVVLCQVKINVTNAYAGSIAWSNFFSRLTHSHPGRVVWLFFNVMIALLVMALGVYESLEHILGIYSNVAVAWVGALVADLVINKPLGLSPKHIEFKRAYLYDINPVGFGSMLLASLAGILAYIGVWGDTLQALSSFVALLTAFAIAPVIAVLTRGRYYLARDVIPVAELGELTPVSELGSTKLHCVKLRCVVCDNHFDHEDMATCPAYKGHICSLCCTLESRCHDQCKTGARFSEQTEALLTAILPVKVTERINPRVLQFSGLLLVIGTVIGLMFALVYVQAPVNDAVRDVLGSSLIQVYV